MQIRPIIELSQDIVALIQQSRQHMVDLYPADSIYQEDSCCLLESNVYFVGGYLDSKLTGIGAVKKFDTCPRYGEIKNLFVDREYRGRGVSRLIMGALEQHLIEQKITLCRLETGVNQPESIGLYRTLGYTETTVYGDYKPDQFSVFMQKEILPE